MTDDLFTGQSSNGHGTNGAGANGAATDGAAPPDGMPPPELAAVFGADVHAKADEVVARYPRARSALLPLLHLVQSVEGYVSRAGIAFCAQRLDISPAEVSAVATFYTMYKRRPCGEHLVSVCTNTLCAALGGDAIYAALREDLFGEAGHPAGAHDEGQTAGEPGAPGSVTLEHVECLAACDLAPVLQVNYEFFDKQTPESARELVAALRRGDRPHPSRGAPLTDFKTAERQLAGFFDTAGGSLAETAAGPSGAEETLRGARLAAERGWTAPTVPDDAPLPPLPQKK